MSSETKISTPGIHHITAITGDVQKNIDFYTGVLGLRLVKLTVNFDDPSAYHLYYGDKLGRFGTLLTFFLWRNLPQGKAGAGCASTVSFSVPKNSLDFWSNRLEDSGVSFQKINTSFGNPALTFKDPDGMVLELVEDEKIPEAKPWETKDVSNEKAIQGFFSATILEKNREKTEKFLLDILGLRLEKEDGVNLIYRAEGEGSLGKRLLLKNEVDSPGLQGKGSIHHIAFQTRDLESQREFREKVLDFGYEATPIINRKYFHSVYFFEPGGVLFEVATQGPGMEVDEDQEKLGTSLTLPPRFEPMREEIEKTLPKLKLPSYKK